MSQEQPPKAFEEHVNGVTEGELTFARYTAANFMKEALDTIGSGPGVYCFKVFGCGDCGALHGPLDISTQEKKDEARATIKRLLGDVQTPNHLPDHIEKLFQQPSNVVSGEDWAFAVGMIKVKHEHLIGLGVKLAPKPNVSQ